MNCLRCKYFAIEVQSAGLPLLYVQDEELTTANQMGPQKIRLELRPGERMTALTCIYFDHECL